MWFYPRFQLPEKCEYIEAFDFFFLIHKILHLKFDKAILNAMNSVQNFFYKVQDGQKQATVHMKKTFNMIIQQHTNQ